MQRRMERSWDDGPSRKHSRARLVSINVPLGLGVAVVTEDKQKRLRLFDFEQMTDAEGRPIPVSDQTRLPVGMDVSVETDPDTGVITGVSVATRMFWAMQPGGLDALDEHLRNRSSGEGEAGE